MAKIYALIIPFFLFHLTISAQTVDDTLIGILDQQLIKINRNTGGVNPFVQITGLPPGANTYKLTWCEPNQCFYFISQSFPPKLAKVDLSGNATVLGTLTINPGTLYMGEGLAFNRFDGELYLGGSLDGDPNSNPPDFYSETLLRIDTSSLTTTIVGALVDQNSSPADADAMTFDDNGMFYFYDGQPGQFNHFFMQDMTFLNPPVLMQSGSYVTTRDLTVKDDNLFYSQNRILKKINIPTLIASNVGTMFTAADFNGDYLLGITWKTTCAPQNLFGNDTSICSGQSIALSPSISGTSYLWQDGSTNPTLTASSSGLYWVEMTNGGCTYSDSIVVDVLPAPTFSLGNDTTLCLGQTFVLDASSTPGTYLWQNGSTVPTYTVSSAGTYSLQITNNGCTSSDTIDVAYLNAPSFTLGNDTTLCFGESLVIDASANPGTYLWQDGSTAGTYTATQSGVYWLEVSNICGSDSDTLILNYHPDYSFNLGNDTTICDGESVELVCNVAGATVTWQDGTTGNSYNASVSGIYSAEFTLNGCTVTDAIVVTVISAPVVDLGEDFFLCEGKFKLLSADNQNGSLLWNTGSSEQSIQVTAAGTYSVVVTNPCGVASDSVVVEMEDCYCGFYVPNAFTPNDDEYNGTFGPVSDCILDAYSFEIYNRWGEVVFETQDPFQMWDATYKGKIVQDGIYTYKITYSSEYVIAETITGHVVVIR